MLFCIFCMYPCIFLHNLHIIFENIIVISIFCTAPSSSAVMFGQVLTPVASAFLPEPAPDSEDEREGKRRRAWRERRGGRAKGPGLKRARGRATCQGRLCTGRLGEGKRERGTCFDVKVVT